MIIKRGNRYQARVEGLPDANGNRKRRSVGTFEKRKDAERAERKALDALDVGKDIAPGRIRVRELLELYLDSRKSARCEMRTIEEYRRQSALYIEPHLGAMPVIKLRPAIASSWLTNLLAHGGAIDKQTGIGRPLSAKTVRHARALLSQALRWGMHMELAGRNVCDVVAAPALEQRDGRAIAEDERRRLIAVARGTRWEHFIALSFAIGTRRGELVALHWTDVDLAAGVVTIRQSLSQTEERGLILKSTKNGETRIVPLAAAARDAFKRQRALQAADQLRLGPLYQADPLGPVFTSDDGSRVTLRMATSAFARLAKKANVETTRLHATRHTAASEMVAGGVDPKSAAEILGHDVSVMMKIYAHANDAGRRSAVDVLDARLRDRETVGTHSGHIKPEIVDLKQAK